MGQKLKVENEVTGTSEAEERGIAKEPVKREQASKLKLKKKKGRREIKANRKVNKKGKKKEKRIHGKP
jgi:hypothetical protein